MTKSFSFGQQVPLLRNAQPDHISKNLRDHVHLLLDHLHSLFLQLLRPIPALAIPPAVAQALTCGPDTAPMFPRKPELCIDLHPLHGALCWSVSHHEHCASQLSLMLWSQESLAHLERICPLPTLAMTSLELCEGQTLPTAAWL